MRLVTRGDLDGLTSAVIITSSEAIEEVVLIHPQDITDKKFEVTGRDILANLHYHPKCGKWFDHHLLTQSNERPPEKFEGRYGLAPSAALRRRTCVKGWRGATTATNSSSIHGETSTRG